MKKSVAQTSIEAYAGFFKSRRLLVLAFVVVLTFVSLYGITRLTFDDDMTKLFLSPKAIHAAALEDIRTRTERAVLVVLEADNLFSPESLGVIRRVDEELNQLEGVAAVVSIIDLRSPKRIGQRRVFLPVMPPPDADIERIQRAGEMAMRNPMAREQLLSRDGSATLMLLDIGKESLSTAKLEPLLGAIRKVLDTSTRSTSVKATLTGFPVLRVEIAKSTVRDELTFNILGCLVATVIAAVALRRAASVVIVIAGAFAGVVWTFGCLGLVGERINPLNAVISPLALAIGMATSIHLLMHIRAERSSGADRLEAVASSLSNVGLAAVLSSLTTVIGFASLGTAELQALSRFGVAAAVAVAFTFVSVMTVVPLLGSSFLGDRIQVAPKALQEPAVRAKWHMHLSAFVADHRVAVLAVSSLVTAAALYVAVHARTDPRMVNILPSLGATRRDFENAEQKFGGALPLVATVRWAADLQPDADQLYNAIADAHHALEGRSIISPPLSLVNLFQSMPEKDRDPISLFEQLSIVPADQRALLFDEDARQALVVARCRDAGGTPIDELLTSIESDYAQLEAKHPGFRFGVAETVIHQIRNANTIVKDLIDSLMTSVPLTIGVIMLALRSFRAGLLSLSPNIFPMAALAATMVIFGQPITLTGAAVFVMCFGIAVDDTIHQIMGFNRNRAAGQPVRDAIVNTMRDLGDAVVSTTVILVGGVGVVMLGQAYATRIFGVMFCIGLFYALVGDLIITPALLACFPGSAKQGTAAAEFVERKF
jgi:predicted RND superfamily exporter protein